MALVNVDKLAKGMVLSDDVCDSNSRLLLRKGLELDNKHMRILKMWGIFQVRVQGASSGDSDDNGTQDSDRLDEISGELKRCFQSLDLQHPAIREVLRLSVMYRIENNHIPEEREKIVIPADMEQVDKKKILSAINRVDVKLPEVPSLVFELNEIIANPMSSAIDIAGVVNQSPSLAAMLLKIVNSAFYGFRSKIDSIPRAVMLIGSKEVSNLALGITIMETFKDIPKKVIDVASFMEHNLACGIVARLLASHGNTAHSEQLFVSGMLHDIGRLVLCKYFPKMVTLTLADSLETKRPLLKSEIALLGITHMQIGKKLLKKWKLPYSLENNVNYHHNPSAAPDPELAAIVQMADIIVHGMGVGDSGEQIIPTFDDRTWQRLNLSVAAFQTVINQAVQQIGTFRQVFNKG